MIDGTRPAAALRRPGDQERRRLRRVAPDGRRARHARPADRKSRSRCCPDRRRKPRCNSSSTKPIRDRQNEPVGGAAVAAVGDQLACRPAHRAAVGRGVRRARRAGPARRRNARTMPPRSGSACATSRARSSTAPGHRRNRRLWRLAVKPTTPPLQLGDAQWIEWGGAVRWLVSDLPAAALFEAAKSCGGHATLFRGMPQASGVFTPAHARAADAAPQSETALRPAGASSIAGGCTRF